ncbi:MAG: hypothetical protein AAF621_03550 [Pseudomonadota bacterium]
MVDKVTTDTKAAAGSAQKQKASWWRPDKWPGAFVDKQIDHIIEKKSGELGSRLVNGALDAVKEKISQSSVGKAMASGLEGVQKFASENPKTATAGTYGAYALTAYLLYRGLMNMTGLGAAPPPPPPFNLMSFLMQNAGGIAGVGGIGMVALPLMMNLMRGVFGGSQQQNMSQLMLAMQNQGLNNIMGGVSGGNQQQDMHGLMSAGLDNIMGVTPLIQEKPQLSKRALQERMRQRLLGIL